MFLVMGQNRMRGSYIVSILNVGKKIKYISIAQFAHNIDEPDIRTLAGEIARYMHSTSAAAITDVLRKLPGSRDPSGSRMRRLDVAMLGPARSDIISNDFTEFFTMLQQQLLLLKKQPRKNFIDFVSDSVIGYLKDVNKYAFLATVRKDTAMLFGPSGMTERNDCPPHVRQLESAFGNGLPRGGGGMHGNGYVCVAERAGNTVCGDMGMRASGGAV